MSNDILFFCPRWGSEHIAWKDFASQVGDAGYDGIEFGVSRDMTKQELEGIFKIADECKMLLIPQQYDTFDGQFSTHKKAFEAWFEKLKSFQPLFINSQTGKDFFSMEENAALFDIASAHTNTTGITVYHETHRNKCLFAAHIARQYFETFPQLQITLDMSHWVCVAESLLSDQEEAMRLASQHTAHIHARVGYPEGPQVTDPFLQQWEKELVAHLRWWDIIAERKRKENAPITITPEFGAFPYMVHLPHTNEPIADQWNINLSMMTMLKKRYQIL